MSIYYDRVLYHILLSLYIYICIYIYIHINVHTYKHIHRYTRIVSLHCYHKCAMDSGPVFAIFRRYWDSEARLARDTLLRLLKALSGIEVGGGHWVQGVDLLV